MLSVYVIGSGSTETITSKHYLNMNEQMLK